MAAAAGPRTPREDAEARRREVLGEYALLSAPADPEVAAVLRLARAATGAAGAAVVLLAAGRRHVLARAGGDGPVSAAAPLVSPEGHVLGALCVHGAPPETPHDAALQDLARVLVGLFERRRQARRHHHLAAAAEEARTTLELAHAELAARSAALATAVAELERSNGELEHFAAVASHDLRAPLTVVDGYVELVAEVYGERLDQRARDWLATARGGAARMAALIDALLGYAAAGAEEVACTPVDVGGVLELVRLDLLADLEAAGASLEAGPLPVLAGDAVQLRQLLQNLVANAVKFRRPDRPPRVRCWAEPGDGGWTIAVADDGRGIPQEHRAAVFGMFERAGGPGAAAGHGIGLATCQRVVHRHGGRIWAEETPGGGATIRFTLPGSALPVVVSLDAAAQPSVATQGPAAP
ncbi:ATP-binding protein [Quadrisphaera sp. DSM 44207]|uniref:sensor histidine kinase n=1 Tax=Quadrisphaera sp. DSM 44207 TaxID=1881057 RepID=UPI000887D5DF|nr:ATP-binding protein [Quadrisphaera sp. DSM 44207]SDQ68795.1 His Kinase A (phospho-acceptor) domain-containing protein [Quadrisphaera sp. DSM 44207]